MDIAVYAALGCEAVPGPAPAGRDVRYEDDFTALQAEIDKMATLGAQEPVNWGTVETLGVRILKDHSKDFLAASYLAVALLHLHGMAGLSAGLGLWQNLCDNFWEAGFPTLKRLRARVNAFSWWQEKMADWLRRYDGSPLDADFQASVLEAARQADSSLVARMPDLPPWVDTINLIKRLPVKAAPAQPVAEPAPAPAAVRDARENPPQEAAAPEKTPAATPVQPVTPALPEDAQGARKILAQAASVYASFMLDNDPQDPLAWQAGRLAAWACLERLPPADGGITMLEAPEPSIRAGMERLLDEKNYHEAAKAADAQKDVYFFWLDPHRYVYEALEKLGYSAAAAAVRQETKLFVLRFSGIEHLCFADGTPFADAATLAWLKESDAEGGAAEPSIPFLTKAEKLVAAGETAKALALLAEEGLTARDGSRRLLALIGQVRILARAGHAGIAAPLADMLLAEVDAHGLEEWAPPLAVQALTAAREAYAELGEEGGKNARDATARLMRLDPTTIPGL